MTVQTAPERAGPRNIKNKLVQLIHNVVPPHSCFPHDWAAPPQETPLSQRFLATTSQVAVPSLTAFTWRKNIQARPRPLQSSHRCSRSTIRKLGPAMGHLHAR